MYVLVEFKQKRLKYHLKMCVFDDFGSELECCAGLRSEADVFRCELERICSCAWSHSIDFLKDSY